MTTRHYDVVVLGGRLGAALTAALLAKRGLRGLLIDQGELASVDGGMLEHLVMSDQASAAMDLVHGELGVKDELKVRTLVAPPVQAVFPDQRVDLFSFQSALIKDLARAFGSEAQTMPAFLDRLTAAEGEVGRYLAEAGELPASGFFARRHAAAAARRHADVGARLDAAGLLGELPEPLAEIFLAALPFLTHLDARRASELSLARFARPVARFLRGFHRFEDGRALLQLFVDLAERKGFELKKSAVESLEPRGKLLTLKLVGHREDLITTDALVDATADLSGLDAIPHKHQSKDHALMLQAAKPRGYLHLWALELDRQVLPPGMSTHVLLLNGRKDRSRFDASDPDAEDRPILLSQREVSGAPARVRLVAQHPVSSSRAHAQRIEQLDAVIRARVERLIPFLEDGAPKAGTTAAHSEAAPERTHPLYDPELDPAAGIGGVPMRTGIKNVLLAGPAVMPGLGMEGDYFTALQAADACEALRGVKKPKSLGERIRA